MRLEVEKSYTEDGKFEFKLVGEPEFKLSRRIDEDTFQPLLTIGFDLFLETIVDVKALGMKEQYISAVTEKLAEFLRKNW